MFYLEIVLIHFHVRQKVTFTPHSNAPKVDRKVFDAEIASLTFLTQKNDSFKFITLLTRIGDDFRNTRDRYFYPFGYYEESSHVIVD